METPTVWIADSAMRSARAGAEHERPYETGGVLVGWHSPERAEYVVTELALIVHEMIGTRAPELVGPLAGAA